MDRVQTSSLGSHLIRAAQRYFNRLGNQLAGSIAFISMMALVPVLMFAFSAVGLTFTVLRPDLLGVVQMLIVDNLHAGPDHIAEMEKMGLEVHYMDSAEYKKFMKEVEVNQKKTLGW